MDVIIFVGPTIPVSRAKVFLDAQYLPPASQGDIYRAAMRKPSIIGVIDGYFERVPSVLHKEILWAIEQGVMVYGCSSMGALRASELYEFGMNGVGQIFEKFRDGILEDDDEVALIHGPSDSGYVNMSEPMVNLRSTFLKAESSGIIDKSLRCELVDLAKSLFYPDRNYDSILKRAVELHLVQTTQAKIVFNWLTQNRVDQKLIDAIEMLNLINENKGRNNELKRSSFRMEYTEWWDSIQRQADKLSDRTIDENTAIDTSQFFDEVRLVPELYQRVVRDTIMRHLLVREANRRAWKPDEAAVAKISKEFRITHNIDNQVVFTEWLRNNAIDTLQFNEAMRELIIEASVCHGLFPNLIGQMRNLLCTTNELGHILARAKDKHEYINFYGVSNPDPYAMGLTKQIIVDWYFTIQLNVQPPNDLASYAITAGFRDEDSFLLCITIEHFYLNYMR